MHKLLSIKMKTTSVPRFLLLFLLLQLLISVHHVTITFTKLDNMYSTGIAIMTSLSSSFFWCCSFYLSPFSSQYESSIFLLLFLLNYIVMTRLLRLTRYVLTVIIRIPLNLTACSTTTCCCGRRSGWT